VPAAILTIIGTIFLMGSIPVLKYIWPLLLIGAGVFALTRPGSDNNNNRGQ
jgi:drug/metabolite transporter (DMT)-like permease